MKVCITCQTDVEGKSAVPIKEDRIIKTIRAIKKALGVAQMNELYVCQNCLVKHAERRKSFEKSMLFASVFAGLILVVLLAAIALSGRFDAWAILSSFVVAGFVLVLPVFRYAPAIEAIPQPPAPVPAMPPPSPMPMQPSPPPPPVVAKEVKEEGKKKKSRSKK